MKLKQFETILLDAAVNVKFCVSWSDDNKISVIAEDGVHIYELRPLQCEVFSSATAHSWIPNSSSSPFFEAVINNRMNNFLWKLNRNQLCEIVVNSSMTYNFKTYSSKCRIVQSFFSPLICGESYISCLRENGCLDIFKMNLNKWTPVINVTEEWIKYQLFQAESELDFENFKLRMHNLKIVTHVWSKKPNIFLLTGHEDGCVVIWAIDFCAKFLHIAVKIYLQSFETPSALAMTFFPDLSMFGLFVGVVNGKILTFSFDEKFVAPQLDLWKEQDLIPARTIKPYHVDSLLYVFTIKHNIILCQILKTLPKNIINILKVEYFEFSSPIVELRKFQSQMVVALQNHCLHTVEICDNLLFRVHNLITSFCFKDDIDANCYGLALSKNFALWITASSKVSCSDKHGRDATRLQIFVGPTLFYKSLSDSSGSGLLEKIISTNDDIKLTEILDLLELKKFDFLVEQTSSGWSFSEKKDLTLSQLKLLLWEVNLKMSCHSNDLQTFADNLKYLIALKYANEQIEGSQQSSRNALLAFLEEKNSKKSDTCLSECLICKEPQSPENFKMCSCVNLHRFPRCNISFLPCSNTPYALCKQCNTVALLEYVSDEGNRCLYCDGLLMDDNRLRPKIS